MNAYYQLLLKNKDADYVKIGIGLMMAEVLLVLMNDNADKT